MDALKQALDRINDLPASKRLTDKMRELTKELEEYERLDHDFREILTSLADHDGKQLYDKNAYPNIAASIDPSSTVIYFKSAGVFRVYDSDSFIDLFQNRVRTNYKDQTDIYEVVNGNHPQKIVVIADSRDEEELEKIKQYVVEYTSQTHSKIKMNDLIVFDNPSSRTFEIVIRNVALNSSDEKKIFVDGLLHFIESKEKNAKISNKLTKRSVSDLPGAELALIPELKQILGPVAEQINGYVSRVSGTPVILNINIYKNSQVTNATNCTVNNTQNIASTEISDEDFIKHLESGNFEWFQTGNEVALNKLHNEYLKFNNISVFKFANKFRNKLYKKTNRRAKNSVGKFESIVKIL